MICTAESCVDNVTCLCCVKCLFYHYHSSPADDESWVDFPCSCAPSRGRLTRWACLVLLSLLLPCLICYWPLRGVFKLVDVCKCEESINDINEIVITTEPVPVEIIKSK